MTAAVRSSAWPVDRSAVGQRAVIGARGTGGAGVVVREQRGQAGRLFDIETAIEVLRDVSEFDCRPAFAAGVASAPAGEVIVGERPHEALPVGNLVLATAKPRPVGAPLEVGVDELARMIVDGEIASASIGRDVVVLLAGRVCALTAGRL